MLISIVVALVLACLILWAITQFPLDATIVKLIRVVVVVAVVLWLLNVLLGFGWGNFGNLPLGRHR
jgi:type IV secretory pathway TrbL component